MKGKINKSRVVSQQNSNAPCRSEIVYSELTQGSPKSLSGFDLEGEAVQVCCSHSPFQVTPGALTPFTPGFPPKIPCMARTDRLDGNQRPLVPRLGSFFPQNPHAHFEVPISVEIIARGCRDSEGLGSARRFLRGLCIYQGTTAESQF
ncbi:hypothetical protein Nmel_004985 [Mimus melanotis]